MKSFKKNLLYVFVLLFLTPGCNQEPKDYLHESQKDKDKRMEWWRDAGFGMFIHWGIYSVPAGIYQGKAAYAEWIMNQAHIPKEEYEKYAEDFNPVKFNAKYWVKLAKDEAERGVLWAGRKGAFGSVGQVRPSYLCCDGTVPRTKLPAVLNEVIEIGKKYDLPIGNVFHAGDGNLHPLIMFDERDPDEKERVLKAATEILKACADAGGTISGEHGVGLEKLRETSFIFSENDLEFERKLKRAFDPDDIINPGKMIPEPVCVH
jgi:FAD/FMN-containing dehydrogenase